MKTAINIARATVVSFEFVVIAIAFLLTLIQPDWLGRAADHISTNGEIIKYLVVIPLGIFAWVFPHSRTMLFPDEDKKKIFQNWPDYQLFKHTVLIGVAYSLLFAVLGIATWAIDWKQSPLTAFTWCIASIVGCGISGFTMYHAEIKLNEIFNQLTDNSANKSIVPTR